MSHTHARPEPIRVGRFDSRATVAYHPLPKPRGSRPMGIHWRRYKRMERKFGKPMMDLLASRFESAQAQLVKNIADAVWSQGTSAGGLESLIDDA